LRRSLRIFYRRFAAPRGFAARRKTRASASLWGFSPPREEIIFPHHAESDVFVSLCGISHFSPALGAALRSGGVERASLDFRELFSARASGVRRSPFPAVSPHVYRPARGQGFCVGVDGRSFVADSAVEIRVLRHMARGELPFRGGRQAVGRPAVLLRKPFAVGFGVLARDVYRGIPCV